MTSVDQLWRAAENLVRRDALAQYEAWLAGAPAPPPHSTVREGEGPDPLSPQSVLQARDEAGAEGEGGAARVRQLLYRGLVAGALDRALRPALAQAYGSSVAHLSWHSGEATSPAQGIARLDATEDVQQREMLFGQLLEAWSGSAPAYLEAVRVMHRTAGQLGLGSADERMRVLGRVEPQLLRGTAVRLLSATDGLYRRSLQQAVEAHQLPPHPAHLLRLFDLPEMEHRFTRERMLPVAGSLLEQLGLNVTHETGLQLLADPLESARASRAFPINLPREVRLVVNRAAGLRWAQAHLLALGQALHWLHTEPGPFPCRWPFGHRAISDAFGLLLASLLTHPEVLVERGLPTAVAEALGRVAQRSLLLHLRTLAALLELDPSGPECAADPHQAYAEAIGRARLIPVSELEARAWPVRVEATHAAETLQSWLLAAALRQALVGQLGSGWYRRPATAELWLEWQKPGQRLDVTEMLALLDPERPSRPLPLDPSPLIDWLHEADR